MLACATEVDDALVAMSAHDDVILEQNRSIGRRVLLEMWGQGRLEVADELYAAEYIDHVGTGPESSEVHGVDGIKDAVTMFRTAFPDLVYEIDELMVEHDLVLTRFSAHGTHLGPFLGLAPTGVAISYTGFDLNRVRDGTIIESWVTYDALGLLQQLGLAPKLDG